MKFLEKPDLEKVLNERRIIASHYRDVFRILSNIWDWVLCKTVFTKSSIADVWQGSLNFYFSLNIDVDGHVCVLSWSWDLSWRERNTTGRTTHGWQVKGEKPDKYSEEYYDRRQQLVLVAPIIIVDRPGTVNTDGYLDDWSTVMCKVHWEFTRFHWKSCFEVKV